MYFLSEQMHYFMQRKACKTPQTIANKDAEEGFQPNKKKLVLQRDKLIEKIKKYSNILRKEARIFAFIKPPLLLLLLKKQHMTYAML
jgi:hypothetical protein